MDSQELPSEIIFEVLSRTSLTTLDTCKAVCKTWKQLTYDPTFMPLFCKRTNNISGYLIQTLYHGEFLSTFVSINQSEEEEEEGGRISISSRYGDMKILASSNQGICCCEQRYHKSHRFYVCKPATQQWQALPNPKLRYETVGVAIMVLRSNPLRYKIVRLSELPIIIGCMKQYICEIFDSELWSWRKIKGHVNLPYDEFVVESQPAVSIGESVYWLTTNDDVLRFEVSEEHFDKFSLPEAVHKNDNACKCKQILEYEGKLGFACLSDNQRMMLWLLEGASTNYEWTRKMSIDIGSSEESIQYPSYVGFYSSKVAFLMTFWAAMFCRLQENQLCEFTEAKMDCEFIYATQVFQFRSDLEMVNLKGCR